MNSVFSGRMKDQTTPAATNIEQPLAGTKPQLAADVIELLLLCRFQTIFCRLEVSAGIHHRPVEPQLVEIVGNIVVKADRLPVTGSGVKSASQPGGLRPVVTLRRQAQQQTCQLQLLFRSPVSLREMLRQRKNRKDVSGDVEFVMDVSFTKRDLPGSAEHGPQCAGVINAPGKTAELSGLRI